LQQASLSLQNAGADFIIICTNTMHKLLPQIQQNINIPFLHIATATANEIKKSNIKKIGLLGTKFTMQEDFYKQILINEGISVTIPDNKDMEIVPNIDNNGYISLSCPYYSKKIFIDIINITDDIEGIILGCTEIGLLINQNDFSNIEVFDTTKIHAKQAVEYSLGMSV